MFGKRRSRGRARKRLSFATVKKINALLKEGLVQEARDEFSNPGEDSDAPGAVEVSLRDEAIKLLRQADAEDAATVWNDWREKTAIRDGETVDYPYVDLSSLDFSEFPFPLKPHEANGKHYTLKTIDGYNFDGIDLDYGTFRSIALVRITLDGNYGLTFCKFDSTLFIGCVFKHVWFDDSVFTDAVMRHCRFEGCDGYRVAMTNCDINECHFDGFKCPQSYIRNTTFRGGSIRGLSSFDAEFRDTRFIGGNLGPRADGSVTEIPFAKLTNVAFSGGCTLTNVDFDYSLFNKVNFSGATFRKSSFAGVMYRRRRLQNCFRGVEGLSTITGNEYFKADALDQKFFDDIANDDREFQFDQAIKKAAKEKSARGRKTPLFKIKGIDFDEISYFLEKQLNPFGLFCGLLIGVLVLCSVFDFNFPEIIVHPLLAGAIALCASLIVSLAMGAPGRKASHFAWQLLDYGRDWDRILGLAFAIIAVMGTVYAFVTPADICYMPSPIAPAHGSCEAPGAGGVQHPLNIYPWFVSLMGFTTLGMADFVQARSTVGAIIMAANAFAGYAVLGLFLAVLQASFMRRRPNAETVTVEDKSA